MSSSVTNAMAEPERVTFFFHAFHNGQNVHILLVFILVGFPGGAAGNLIKARGDAGVIDLRIRRHGVPGKIHAGDFFFP